MRKQSPVALLAVVPDVRQKPPALPMMDTTAMRRTPMVDARQGLKGPGSPLTTSILDPTIPRAVLDMEWKNENHHGIGGSG